jgi:hypothetical protein
MIEQECGCLPSLLMDPSKQPVYFFFFIRQVGACKMAAEETIDRKTEVLLVTAAAWPPRHRSTSSVDLVAAEASTTTSGCLTACSNLDLTGLDLSPRFFLIFKN